MLPLVQNSNQMEPRQSKRKNINLPKNQNQPQVGSVVQVLFFLQNSKNSSKEKPKWYKGIVTHIFKKNFQVEFDDGEVHKINYTHKW